MIGRGGGEGEEEVGLGGMGGKGVCNRFKKSNMKKEETSRNICTVLQIYSIMTLLAYYFGVMCFTVLSCLVLFL